MDYTIKDWVEFLARAGMVKQRDEIPAGQEGKRMQRVYRSARRCPHCGSNGRPKAGFSHGKQTYRCGECRHHPSPEGNRHYHPP